MDSQTTKATRILETLESYSISGDQSWVSEEKNPDHQLFFEDEMLFWNQILATPDALWNQQVNLRNFTLSESIARIPGLYWNVGSSALRLQSETELIFKNNERTEYQPSGKSKIVLGGIGTMKLPRASDGAALFCVTSSCNASMGIPIAITGSIIDDLKLKEGDLLNINNAKWTKYTREWSRSFPTTKGIPRGFLQIDSHKMISVIRSGHSVISHPFSVMEYETENNFLYDFVFCSALSNVGRNVRSDLERFFERYRKDKDRNGRYLINTDLVDPLFDAYYFAPSEMNNPLEKAKLDLLYKRVSNVPIAGITLDLLLERLPMFYNTPQAIQTLATKLGIARSHLVEGNAASMSSYLINYCIDREKIDRLIKYISIDYKEIFEK